MGRALLDLGNVYLAAKEWMGNSSRIFWALSVLRKLGIDRYRFKTS